VRPAAYASFCGPEWEALFRGFDAEETGTPLEVLHPYVDLRLLRYLLSVPPIPWCRSKLLIRRAMRAELPDAVLSRSKSGMTGDPDYETIKSVGLPPLTANVLLSQYVDPARIPEVSGSSMIAFRADFRPRALNYWLSNLRSVLRDVDEENEHETAHA
jgi:asparagine synthase (glutamine-hydrolysing)